MIGNSKAIDNLLEAIEQVDHDQAYKIASQVDLSHAFSRDGITPLLHAIEYGDLRMVRLLLDAGADPDFTTLDRPIYEAIRRGKREIVDLLIERGVDPSSPDAEGFTPLMIAAACDEDVVAQKLINLGVNVTAVNSNGHSAYDKARINGSRHVIKILLATGLFKEYKEDIKFKAMIQAARDGDLERVMYYLDQGAPINKREKDSLYSVLTEFADRGDLDAVKQLIDRGADPANINNYSALEGAARFGNLQVVRCLLDHGAHPNNFEKGHNPSILSAAGFGHLDVLKLLIEAGADLTVTDCMGKNVMTEALDYEWRQRRRTEIVDYLISIGVTEYTRLKHDFVRSIRPELVKA